MDFGTLVHQEHVFEPQSMNKLSKILLPFLFLWLCCGNHFVRAQQVEIPGVTDIISITAIASPDSASFVRWVKKNWQDSTYFVRQVTNQLGTVVYREDLKAYVISSGDPTVVYKPDTMVCSQWTGIVCNWPGASKWNNKPVQFNGRYFQARGVMVKYGGEHIYYLHLTHIQ